MKVALETIPWSVQDHLSTTERQVGFFEAALELAVQERDPEFFAKALGEVARARGMDRGRRAAGLTREGLHNALLEDSDPQLSLLIGVIDALELKISMSEKEAV